jgi:hypothetical protein
MRVAMAPGYVLMVFGMIVIPSGSKDNAFILLCFIGTVVSMWLWSALVLNLAYWLIPPKIERDSGDFIKLNLS